MLQGYPKQVALKNGQQVALRPMVREDEKALLQFFQELPLEDRQFLKDDVTDPKVIEAWSKNLDYERIVPILAIFENRVIGDATLHRDKFGWSKHVAEIRIVTDPKLRRKGLGLHLAGEIFSLAQKLNIRKVTAQMMRISKRPSRSSTRSALNGRQCFETMSWISKERSTISSS